MSEGQDGGAPGWPVELRGVTESVVTTLGPNDLWNVAALGIHAPTAPDEPATAMTWGRTRTWRNFRERGGGYVQFTRDPVDFTDAALAVREESDPILESADAWAEIEVEQRNDGTEGDTQWVEWELRPVEAAIVRETVPTTNRGYSAVIEATVAASRLDVPAYERAELESRLEYFADVIETAGGPREREALERIRDLSAWG